MQVLGDSHTFEKAPTEAFERLFAGLDQGLDLLDLLGREARPPRLAAALR